MGTIRVITARYAGALVGFCFNYVAPTLMCKSVLQGNTIAVWIDPTYRLGMRGYQLLRFNRNQLHAWGCKRLCIAADMDHGRLGLVYKRLGYKLDEMSYAL